jgi:hypothetical protein
VFTKVPALPLQKINEIQMKAIQMEVRSQIQMKGLAKAVTNEI